MNNKNDVLKNYIESQKRQRELIEESKKRRLGNNKKEKIEDDSKKISIRNEHENKDYLMKEELQSDYDKKLIHEIKLRENSRIFAPEAA